MAEKPIPTDPLARLRYWRSKRRPARDMSFLAETFERDVARPFRQLEKVSGRWQAVVPAHLLEQTKLESFVRGTLTVTVADSSVHFELSSLVRGNLARELMKEYSGPAIRRIRLRVGRVD